MLNVCVFMGRFPHNPELKTTDSGTPVVKFQLAHNRPRKGQNSEQLTDWIDCTAWGKTAEFICKYFKKGDPIIVEGRIETRQYEDKQGNKRKSYEVIVNKTNFCAFKKDDTKNTENCTDTDIINDLDKDLLF